MALSLRKQDLLLLILLGVFVLCSRIIGSETSPLMWDAASFHLAATDYDISQDRPHLPGYFLHVYCIRFFRLFLSSNAANIAPSVLWSLLGVMALYVLARHVAHRREAFMATLLMASNPMLWFFGSISEIYTVDFALSVSLALLAMPGVSSKSAIYATPFLMALAAGLRQSSPVLLLPFYFWMWYCAFREKRVQWKGALLTHLLALLLCLAWLLPMLHSCGGWEAYRQLYHSHNPMLKASPLQNIAVMASYAIYTLPAFVIVWLLALIPKRKVDTPPASTLSKDQKIALALWIGIPLLVFIMLLYGKGYALIFLGALVLLLLPSLRRLPSVVVYSAVAGQCLLYLLLPYRFPDTAIWQQGGSAVKKFQERSFSVYALSQSHINTMNSFEAQIDSALSLHPSAYIFVDPTFPLSPRALQARHPERRFASLLVRDSGLVQIYEGINIRHSSNLQGIIDSSLVLTTQQCQKQYFSDALLRPVWQRGELVLCQPRPSWAFDSAETVDMIYRRVFVR